MQLHYSIFLKKYHNKYGNFFYYIQSLTTLLVCLEYLKESFKKLYAVAFEDPVVSSRKTQGSGKQALK